MLLFALICLLAGLALGWAGVSLRRAAAAAARWPVTEGVLERCEVVERPDTENDKPSTWGLALEYSYRVGGRSYRSARYAFAEPSSFDPGPAQAIADMLRAQAPLRVRYDPKNHQSAVLSTQPSDQIEKLSLTCFVLAGLSVLVTLVICGAR